MKLLLASIIFISLIAPYPHSNCGCMPAAKDEMTRWGGNETITIKEDKVHKQIFGTVNLFTSDNPTSGALVEVYTHPDYLFLEYPDSEKEAKKQRRVAACITGEDGKFCFGFIKPGKYEVRVSKESGINVTHIYVEVNPYSDESVDTEMDATLTPGT